ANDLDRYGRWISVDDYGPAWVPSYVDTGWAPYGYGRWVIGHSGDGPGFPTNLGDGYPIITAGGTSATSDGAGYPARHSAFISGLLVWCGFIMVRTGFRGSH